jgi:hypothetical protein
MFTSVSHPTLTARLQSNRPPASLCHLVNSTCAGAKLLSFVKRKAGVKPALSRSGDGNEKSQGASQRTVSSRDGKRRSSRLPKVRRPACRHHHGSAKRSPWVRLSLPLSWIGTVDNATLRAYARRCGLRIGGSSRTRREPYYGSQHTPTNSVLRLPTHGQRSRTQVRPRVLLEREIL